MGNIVFCLGMDSTHSIDWAQQVLIFHYHLLLILLAGVI